MCGNLYVSGLVGSDATANNPLPTATPTSTATTRTHNQPQQPHLPISTVATAALQNNRDDPHLAGNEACLCSLCHIKDRFFPRSQDGRIVLPQPTMSIHSHLTRHHPRPIGRFGRSASSASMTSTSVSPLTTSALPPPPPPTHRRNRTDSTASNRDDPKFNEGRRGAAGLRTPRLQSDDNGEGSLTGLGRIPAIADIGESPSHRSRASDEFLHTPQMDELEGRPFSGPSRHTQQSRKYDHKPNKKRPDPWPRIPESEDFSGQSSHLSQQSSSSQYTSSNRTRLELILDKHGTNAHPRNLLQTPLARELSLQTPKLETPRPTTPQTYTGAYGYEHRSIPSPHQGTFDVNMSSYPGTPGRIETSQHHHNPLSHHHSTSQPESLSEVFSQDKLKITKLSSRSKNPQSSDNNNPTPITSGERSVNSSPTRERLPPSSSSHLLQSPQIEDDGGSNQTQFRFQEPVVPEAHTTSPVQSRDLSIVQVKWDSERKRRQGYFAQEEGSEKSPFRHYNKADCDFEN